jgi:hypothetical protein
MPVYVIKDSDGNEVNRINASESFVAQHYDHYELAVIPENFGIKKAAEREWRNSELERTDVLATVGDYPHMTELTAYRAALRDWPASADFPDTRPESLEDRIANA